MKHTLKPKNFKLLKKRSGHLEKYAVIMAGGSGTRLWPLSRENKPKQFISVDGTKSFLVQTIERICGVVPPENCFVITNKAYLHLTKEDVNGLIPVTNIIVEPYKKTQQPALPTQVSF